MVMFSHESVVTLKVFQRRGRKKSLDTQNGKRSNDDVVL